MKYLREVNDKISGEVLSFVKFFNKCNGDQEIFTSFVVKKFTGQPESIKDFVLTFSIADFEFGGLDEFFSFLKAFNEAAERLGKPYSRKPLKFTFNRNTYSIQALEFQSFNKHGKRINPLFLQ